MLKKIDRKEWNNMYDYEGLCETFYSVNEFTEKFGIEFEEYQEDGFGTCFSAFVEVDGQKYFLQGFRDRGSKELGVVFNMQGNNPRVSDSINSITKSLNIPESDLKWVQKELSLPTWALLRQGDDGNEVEVCRFYKQVVAEHVMKVYEGRGHKQCYTVQEKI